MNISLLKNFNNYKINASDRHYVYQKNNNLAPLNKDTISFTALRKSQFEGIDFAVVEKFKAPIQSFNSNNDFQNWAKVETDKIISQDFSGRHEEAKVQRKAILKEWCDYVINENDEYNNACELLILSAITKDLKPDNDKLPPVLNKGVLADCIDEINRNIKADRNYQFNFNKMYETKLNALYFENDTDTGDGSTKWVVIPSKAHDPEHFKENVDKLKALSHNNWCTKSFNAEPYLSKGDFHVYLENGKPKLGVRFVDDKIMEIQGEKNNSKIPLKYYETVIKYINDNSLKLLPEAIREINYAKKTKIVASEINAHLKPAIEANDFKAILEYFGFEPEENEDGTLTISKYNQPINCTFSDIDINEENLLKNVSCIKGDADFRYSDAINLSTLKEIGGSAYFENSKIKNLDNLHSIGRDADFQHSQVVNLGNLYSIGRDTNFQHSQVTNLNNLYSIGGDANFYNTEDINLNNLYSIGGDANFSYSKVRNMPNLHSIGGDADFSYSKVNIMHNLKHVGGQMFADHSEYDKEFGMKLEPLLE